jgi:hypothetical protein
MGELWEIECVTVMACNFNKRRWDLGWAQSLIPRGKQSRLPTLIAATASASSWALVKADATRIGHSS